MRTVIEDAQVSETIDGERANCPRLENAFDALKWWLARVPERGEILDDVHWLYKQDGDGNLAIPSLVVVYTFDHQCVHLKFILVSIPLV